MYRRTIQKFNIAFNQHTQNQMSKMRSYLFTLFTCKDTKKELSEHLKILPHYFQFDLLKQFCKSRIHEEFWANNIEFKKEEDDKDFLLKHFTTPILQNTINSPTKLQGLEAYIHWLINDYQGFDRHYNNYVLQLLKQEKPDTWYQIKEYCGSRTFIYHHGPTNSGKSTSAVEDLRNLKGNQKGIYMAPLRLLAWEYQQKLENCSLVTGQEKQFKNSNLISCTIEAAPLNEEYEVAVIDEIQMIGDVDRGSAWTKAVLGVKAKRVHLCGDERALGIISKLLEVTEDTLEERRYSRLSKLTLIHKQFKLENISPGDCIINFSMNNLIKHRNDINNFINSRNKQAVNQPEQKNQSKSLQQDEAPNISQQIDIKKTNHTAIVYGKLPPECRKSQALKFNSGQLPYLVATNAIGMGLNLNIRKVVFLSIERMNANRTELLQEHEIQQIAGRAGRGKEIGYVQCANQFILRKVQKALLKVNETYGIQLQNIKDESSETVQAVDDEQQEETKSDQQYSNLLKRYLKEKESKIKAACFYFEIPYIIYCKDHLERLLKKEVSNSEVLAYLKDYCKLDELYFMQQGQQSNYALNLLDDSKMDQSQFFIFLNGLNLSSPGNTIPRSLKTRMEKSHLGYIKNFIQYRKVDLPKFLIDFYEDNFQNFRYMDQIRNYQYYYSLLESYVWLWGKFQFAFHQVQLAQKIKFALSEKINQVLLRNQFIHQSTTQNSFQVAQSKYSSKSRDKASTQLLYRIDSLIPQSHQDNPVKNYDQQLANQKGKKVLQKHIKESNTTFRKSQNANKQILDKIKQIYGFKMKKEDFYAKSSQQVKEQQKHSIKADPQHSTKVHQGLKIKKKKTTEKSQQNQASKGNQNSGLFKKRSLESKQKNETRIETQTSEHKYNFERKKSSTKTLQKQLPKGFLNKLRRKKAFDKIQHID